LTAAAVAFAMRERPFRFLGRVDAERAAGGEAGFWPGMAAAARAVIVEPPLRFAVGFSVLVFTLLRMGLYLYPAYLDAAGLDDAWIGLSLAALSLAAAHGAFRIEAVRRAVGEGALVWGLPLVIALSYAALGRWFTLWGLLLLGVQYVCNGVYSPFSKELLNREIRDSGQRATVLSVESMARRLVFGAFAPLAGVLIDGRGLQSGLYACAALGLSGGALLILTALRRHRRGLHGFEGEITPTPLPEPVAPLPASSLAEQRNLL
jgi:predicted MFS family arabinose efflux permease